MKPLTRRAFLLSSGLSAALIPLMPDALRAQAATPRRRFIVMAVPNGWTNLWYPNQGQSLTIKPGNRLKGEKISNGVPGDNSPLAPLEPFKDKVLVLGNMTPEPHLHYDGIERNDPGSSRPTRPIDGHASSPVLLRVGETSGVCVAGGDDEPSRPSRRSRSRSRVCLEQALVRCNLGARPRLSAKLCPAA